MNRIESHRYGFANRELARLLIYPVLPLLLFASVLHLGSAAGIFPRPRAALDTDRTIVLHQAAATEQTHSAQTILVGDSSCLMDVSAARLSGCLANGGRALNLGTLSYLDLRSYGLLLQHYLAHNTGTVRTVALLMHPEALRQAASGDYYRHMLEQYYSGADFCEGHSSKLACWLGVEIFKGRFLARLLPVPLQGDYGKKYGFTKDLWQCLSENQGSALDPGRFDRGKARGSSEYRLVSSLESASRDFAGTIPKQMKLIVGITPIPDSQALDNYPQTYIRMLQQFGRWLEADVILDRLPPSLPDTLFASKTHLNEAGQGQFTEIFCHSLLETGVGPKTR